MRHIRRAFLSMPFVTRRSRLITFDYLGIEIRWIAIKNSVTDTRTLYHGEPAAEWIVQFRKHNQCRRARHDIELRTWTPQRAHQSQF
jgi:hypothetical protein